MLVKFQRPLNFCQILNSMIEKENQNLTSRPPVVVVLGHVDHGKTSILDFIRKTKVAEKESGGITQHVGAYEVSHQDKKITFIDTPGHEAFSQIRSRGAKVADIAILVVAADEGIKPQTKEAILHIKKSGIPMVVAINKMDKPGADPQKVKRELVKEDILVEGFGGKTPVAQISAKTGQGISDLLELILLVAEMENLKSDLAKSAEGIIIECCLNSKRGAMATLISNQGKLKAGQIIGTASACGKVKILEDFKGGQISETSPSQPVLVLGFEKVPKVGEKFRIFSSIEEAQNIIETKEKIAPEVIVVEKGQKVLNLILKADVLGSLEAIEEVLKNLPQENVILRILKGEVGQITETDIKLAVQSKAKILGFRVKTNPIAETLAEREKIKIMRFDVIYDLVEDVRKYMEKLFEPKIIRTDLGKIKTLVIFLTDKNRQIVGGKVVEGQVKKGALIEIQRAGEVKGKGKMINLQRNKKDIEVVQRGEEAGILYEGNEKIEKDDLLVIYIEERKKMQL